MSNSSQGEQYLISPKLKPTTCYSRSFSARRGLHGVKRVCFKQYSSSPNSHPQQGVTGRYLKTIHINENRDKTEYILKNTAESPLTERMVWFLVISLATICKCSGRHQLSVKAFTNPVMLITSGLAPEDSYREQLFLVATHCSQDYEVSFTGSKAGRIWCDVEQHPGSKEQKWIVSRAATLLDGHSSSWLLDNDKQYIQSEREEISLILW